MPHRRSVLLLSALLASGCLRVVPLGSDLERRDDVIVVDGPEPDVIVDPPRFDVRPDVVDAVVEEDITIATDVADAADAADAADVADRLDVFRPMPTGSVTGLSAGERHSCAVRSDGYAWCWGANEHGQLGDGTTMTRMVPVPVVGLSDVVAVAAGATHTCARNRADRVFCWGNGADGRLFNTGSTSDQLAPVDTGVTATRIAAGSAHTCVIDGGRVRCVGSNAAGQLGAAAGEAVALPAMATAVAMGEAFTCATIASGEAWCWGRNAEGQLGRGSLTPTGAPAAVPGPASVTRLVLGARHACVVASSGAWCWGDRSAGQLGDGVTGAPLATPTRAAMWGAAIPKVAGDRFTCGSTSEYAVCVGANDRGQLGDGTTMARAQPERVTSVVGFPRSAFGEVMTAGARHACLQVNGSEEWCWGDGTDGQRGAGTASASPFPARVRW